MIAFSVIIPNYNHGAYLEKRIDSVLSQDFDYFEVIILDDCSTDNSRDIIEKFRENRHITHIVFNEQNSGSPFLQWKKGISLAKYDWIWIAESDDVADTCFLRKAAETLPHNSTDSIFYCDSITIDETGKESEERFSTQKNRRFFSEKWKNDYKANGITELNECLKFDCTVNNISAVVFSKSLFLKNSQVATEYLYYGDWAFIIQAAMGSTIFYSQLPLNFYRRHSLSLLNSETSIVISRHEYFKILRNLWYSPVIVNKNQLLNHFVYNYLSFGILHDGPVKGFKILRFYFATDRKLAWKVFLKFISIVLLRKKRPFFIPVDGNKK